MRKPDTSKFNPHMRPPQHEETRLILKHVLRRGIITVMSNYIYKWTGVYKLQLKGGGIGDKLAQAAARISMIWWDNQFVLLLVNGGLSVTLYKRYVDDSNVFCPPVSTDLKWNSKTRR